MCKKYIAKSGCNGNNIMVKHKILKIYVLNNITILLMQRKFCRETPEARNNTYHHFKHWIESSYPKGLSEEDFKRMIEEDCAQIGSSSAGGDQSHEQSPLSTPPMMSPISPLPNTLLF